MNLITRIAGIDYLPLRAVPFVSSGLLDATTLSHMICDPESYCDAQYDQIISPVKSMAGRRLVPMVHTGFALSDPLVPTRLGNSLDERLPGGTLVTKDSVKEKFNLITREVWKNNPQLAWPEQGIWDESPTLTSSQREFVLDGLAPSRKNSKQANINVLEKELQKVLKVMAARQTPLDRSNLPGIKKDWIKIFRHLAPQTQKGPHTYHVYFSEMSMKWPQGVDRNAIKRVYDALEI